MVSDVEYLMTISSSFDDLPQLALEELQSQVQAVEVARLGQAKIGFRMTMSPRSLSMLSAPEKIYVVVERRPAEELVLSSDGAKAEDEVAALVANAPLWPSALQVWRSVMDGGDEGHLPQTFRASGKKAGRRFAHLSSNGIAEAVGEAVGKAHGWSVSLTHFDIDVHVHINDECLVVLLPLFTRTDRRQHAFSCPGLSQPVAWAIARSVEIGPGDVVCDPMCGAGIILLEAAQCWRTASYLGFDEDPAQLQRFSENLALPTSQVRRCVSVTRADATRLPLAAASVDAVVSDLPFGKQFGSEEGNVQLYPAVVAEIRRILRPGIGRAALLTNMANSQRLADAFSAEPSLWEVVCRRRLLLGYMEAVLFLAYARPAKDGVGVPAESWRLPWEQQRGRARWNSEKVTCRLPLEPARGRKTMS